MKEKKFIEDLKSNNLFSTSDKLINVTLLPSLFPKNHFIKVKNIQKIFVKLIYCCMKDPKITLQSCDDKLVKLLQEIIKQKPEKEIEFLFFRSDFLLEKFKNEMKLVEINTISCAFLVYGPLINKIHSKETGCLISESKNEFIKQVKFCKEIFEQKYFLKDCVALMIDKSVDESNSNFFEKKILVDELEKENILLYYICEKDFMNIKFENQNMFYKNSQVFFVYYRWYYNYNHFTQIFIDLKIKIEKSNVISLPSAELQLIGSKFFQYIFTDELILQKYLTNEEVRLIKPHFVKLKPKEEFVSGDESKFLIKSFSEGGNNLLDCVNENCFLMEKINSITLYNKFLDGREGQTIPEIGLFGVGLVLNDQIVFAKDAGYIVRSKMEDSKECGVSCGYGALSSIKFEE